MKKIYLFCVVGIVVFMFLATGLATPPSAEAKRRFVTIGTGGVTGTIFT